MIVKPKVPLHRLILSLSQAMDLAHPAIGDHQHRVAHIALSMARSLGMEGQELLDLFHAAALHDIGLVRVENRILGLHMGNLERVSWHSAVGFELLNDIPLFSRPAEILRYHHISWDHGRGSQAGGREVPFSSHILSLSDAVERFIDRNVHILDQKERIKKQVRALCDKQFHPDCVEAFLETAQPESFWLDCVSDRIYSILLEGTNWPSLTIDERSIEPIAKIFARIVDAASRWTATHTAGVAASAEAMAERLHFSPREILLIRAAGYLHDLGKLTVPSRILDKVGKLTNQEWSIIKGHVYHTFRILNTIGGMPQVCEWATFHHERLDGNGYPFRHTGRDLTLGARIMAVADIFTALTEDRPYRKGMGPQKVLSILEKHARSGGVDGDVVDVLRRN